MPTPIILSSVIGSWPILWAIFGGAAAVVIALTILVALATSPRRHARHNRRAAHQPRTASLPSQRVSSEHHALV